MINRKTGLDSSDIWNFIYTIFYNVRYITTGLFFIYLDAL